MGVALRPLIADYKETLGGDQLGGTAAIEAYNALYQFLSGIRQPDGTPLMDDVGHSTSDLRVILLGTCHLLE